MPQFPPCRPPRRLAQDTLSDHRGRLQVPTYDRSALTPAVVHIGVGSFHRAHQLVYFDDLAQRRLTDGWGVRGVGLHHPAMKEALTPQDFLYTVVQRGATAQRARVVGAMIGYHFAPDDPEAVLAALADPRTRLVTLTITGGGYGLDPRTRALDGTDPAVRADLDRPDRPGTVPGYLVEALTRRRAAGLLPFTVLSCDNLPRNGEAARAAVVGFAALRDPGLARWIDGAVSFPNSMVDRITPETTPAERAAVAREIGVDDRWPVITEPFTQWVVEDDFCAGRPPLDSVGVRFVPDVAAYELMKTRLLNASHSALGYLGRLAGHRRTDEVLADPVFAGYVARLMGEEIAPLLPSPDGIDLADYQRILLRRLADPAIGDRLDRLCGRGSTKMPDYVLPSLVQALAEDRPCQLLTLAVAGWLRYLRGVDMDGRPLEVRDALRDTLVPLARSAGTDPRPLLALRPLFGDLGRRAGFVEDLRTALKRLDRDGVRATVAAYSAYDLAVSA